MQKGIFFFENIHQQGNWKKVRFFCDKQRRDISNLLPKVADSQKNTEKSERKRRSRLVRKKAHQKKGENTRMEKQTENNENGGKERVKRRFLQRKNFLFHKTFFKKNKKQKRQIKIKKDF